MKKKAIFETILGFVMLVSALYTYIPEPQYMHELTFISNLAGAVLFLVDGLGRLLKEKRVPKQLYFIEAVTIGTVFLVSVGGTVSGMAHFNFSGGMIFLHVINPIFVIGFYLLEREEKKDTIKNVTVAPIFVMAYLMFDYIRSFFVGSFVYGLFPIEEMSIGTAFLIGIGTYLFMVIWSLLLYGCRQLFQRKSKGGVEQ